jgi:hypothetical protein
MCIQYFHEYGIFDSKHITIYIEQLRPLNEVHQVKETAILY